ncbi:group-specific protein (plasmid) [Bacillus thuringiensis MC28]|nr:group-specific protein [Bacillus thuringiensis MC28]
MKVSEVGTPHSYSEALTVNGVIYAGTSLDSVSSYTGPFGSEKTFRLRIKDYYVFSNTSNSMALFLSQCKYYLKAYQFMWNNIKGDTMKTILKVICTHLLLITKPISLSTMFFWYRN